MIAQGKKKGGRTCRDEFPSRRYGRFYMHMHRPESEADDSQAEQSGSQGHILTE